MAKSMGLTRRAMIALAGLGGMVAGVRIFGTAAARAQPPRRPEPPRRHERLYRALEEMRDAMRYIRETPFEDRRKRRALQALEVAIREVEELIREPREPR